MIQQWGRWMREQRESVLLLFVFPFFPVDLDGNLSSALVTVHIGPVCYGEIQVVGWLMFKLAFLAVVNLVASGH